MSDTTPSYCPRLQQHPCARRWSPAHQLGGTLSPSKTYVFFTLCPQKKCANCPTTFGVSRCGSYVFVSKSSRFFRFISSAGCLTFRAKLPAHRSSCRSLSASCSHGSSDSDGFPHRFMTFFLTSCSIDIDPNLCGKTMRQDRSSRQTSRPPCPSRSRAPSFQTSLAIDDPMDPQEQLCLNGLAFLGGLCALGRQNLDLDGAIW